MLVLTLLCVAASGAGMILGLLAGCMIAMILQGIFAPGAGYDYYSVETPVGSGAILGSAALGAAAPWIGVFVYFVRRFRQRQGAEARRLTRGNDESEGREGPRRDAESQAAIAKGGEKRR